MPQLLESVPNFSEGRNPSTIAALADALQSVHGCYLLHQDVGYDANRTVFTVAGEPIAVVEAVYRAIAVSLDTIDMRQHEGAHPCIGAADVVPLVPVQNLDLDDAARMAIDLGQRVGETLQVPVYLYEAAAQMPARRSLANIRQGGYVGLVEKLQTPAGAPDFGPARFLPAFGATVIGARPFLLAFNINLNTEDVRIAKAIAGRVRTSGSSTSGRHQSGMLPAVRAIGWYMPLYGCAQVSMNLLDYTQTGLKTAYDTVANVAKAYGVFVTGSELIGLAPLQAILDVGKALDSTETSEPQLVTSAAEYLGLSSVQTFRPEERILEWVLRKHF